MPNDTPQPSTLRYARYVLRISVALQCFGFAVWMLRYRTFGGTPFFSMLWHPVETGGFGLGEAFAKNAELACGVLLASAGLITLYRPLKTVLLPLALFQVLFAGCLWRLEIGYWSNLAIPSHALRILLPLVLVFFSAARKKGKLASAQIPKSKPKNEQEVQAEKPLKQPNRTPASWQLAALLLRFAIASTFLAHGLKAWSLSPRFQELIAASAFVRFDLELEQQYIEVLLRVIGGFDIAAACLILIFRWRWLVVWMAVWGAITAASRVVAGGFDLHLHEILTRAAHTGGPLALGLYFMSVTKGVRWGSYFRIDPNDRAG